jgi:hypothetical protein
MVQIPIMVSEDIEATLNYPYKKQPLMNGAFSTKMRGFLLN